MTFNLKSYKKQTPSEYTSVPPFPLTVTGVSGATGGFEGNTFIALSELVLAFGFIGGDKTIPKVADWKPSTATDETAIIVAAISSRLAAVEGNCPAVQVLFDLCACHSVSTLKKENVESYYLQAKEFKVSGSNILKLVSYLSPKVVTILDTLDDWHNIVMSDTTWVKYHMANNSVGSVCLGAVNYLAAAKISGYIDLAQMNAVREAAEFPWSQKIAANVHPRTRVISMAYREAAGHKIGRWHSGLNALSQCAPEDFPVATLFFTRLIAMRSATDQLKSANDTVELAASVGATIAEF